MSLMGFFIRSFIIPKYNSAIIANFAIFHTDEVVI